jgi:Uma2 family endonuclease
MRWRTTSGRTTLGGSSTNRVSPDLIFLTNDQVEQMDMDVDIGIAPALVIEVSSPSSRRYDQTIKLAFYEEIGVTEYWFIDVMPSTVSIYRRMSAGQHFADPIVLREQEAIVTSAVLPGLQLRLADIFNMHPRLRG